MKRHEQHALRERWAAARRELDAAIPEVRTLMEARFAEACASPPDGALAQAGMRVGTEIAEDLISHNEPEMALEHLCYMVLEAELPISPETYAALRSAGEKMNLPPSLWLPLELKLPSPTRRRG